ncbi:MAG: T9SS type A sorting domain-containing protein, partial [Flavobacteriales bacterium]|nr:T9SS type A sorting domain-containing protein [Flavobacteriales bacterium]
ATSIKEHPEENTTIYPNPSTGEIKIETDLNISRTSIYSMIGEMVYSSSASKKTLNLKSLEAGVYLVIIESKNAAVIKRKILIE